MSFIVSFLKAIFLVAAVCVFASAVITRIYLNPEVARKVGASLYLGSLLFLVMLCYSQSHNSFIDFIAKFCTRVNKGKPVREAKFLCAVGIQLAQMVGVAVLLLGLPPVTVLMRRVLCEKYTLPSVVCGLLFALEILCVLVTLFMVVMRVALELHFPSHFRTRLSSEHKDTLFAIHDFFVYIVKHC